MYLWRALQDLNTPNTLFHMYDAELSHTLFHMYDDELSRAHLRINLITLKVRNFIRYEKIKKSPAADYLLRALYDRCLTLKTLLN